MQLFPSAVHPHRRRRGARSSEWKDSPVAQEVIRREGLGNEDELQSYFIRRIEAFLRAHGRRLIGWDETLEGGLAPEATVMSWRGVEGGIEAARQGHDVIMTPADRTYFDYYQGDPAAEPLAIGGFVPLDSVYAFEPVPGELTPGAGRPRHRRPGKRVDRVHPDAGASRVHDPPPDAGARRGPLVAEGSPELEPVRRAAPGAVRAAGCAGRGVPRAGAGGPRRRTGWCSRTGSRLTIDSPFPGGRFATRRWLGAYGRPRPDTRARSTSTSPRAPMTVSARVFLPNGRGSPVARARIARATWAEPVAVRADTLRPGLAYAYVEGDVPLGR